MQQDVSKHQEECAAEITKKKMLEDLRARAWTFQGLNPPNNAIKVAEETRNGELYEYYIDADGNVWFQREISKKYEIEIAQWAKERQKKKH